MGSSSSPPTWTLLAFAGVAQSLGQRKFYLPRTAGVSVEALKKQILSNYYDRPGLAELLASCRVAVDHTMFNEQDLIPEEAQEIALIPPVSGGSDPLHHQGEKSVLTQHPLNVETVMQTVMHENAGGVDIFIGNVRRKSRGLEVTHLEYEAYPAMALKVMDQICRSIEADIEGSKVCIHHRYGRLNIGEAAVAIAASAPHRAPAFDACRRAIETLKQDVPIWKKEFDVDGGTWIGQGP